MKSRHRAREVALQFLYQLDVAAGPSGLAPSQSMSLIPQIQSHFSHFQVPEGIREFSAQLVAGSLGQLAPIDEIIEKHATHWKIGRMSAVDRCLLRLATYELLYSPETPPSVVIDEAVELGKQFGTAETPSFINGILDAIFSHLKEEKGDPSSL